MRIVWAASVALALCALIAGQAHAAGPKTWSNRTLHLGLAYPGNWRVVPERGAALKLVAPDAGGEFEIFSLPTPSSAERLASLAAATLVRLHCGKAMRQATGNVGHLDVAGTIASGACTGGDRGWQLTVTVFAYGHGTVLVRSWLFHQQPRDRAALGAIAASLVADS
jgi:hypothetical protein